MKFNQSLAIAVVTLGLTLGACNGGEQQTSTESASPAAESPVADSASPETAPDTADHDDAASQGGQVVESGPYHLELVPVSEENGTHLDFYLQKGDTHEAIPDAQVTAQVQLPDGSQESIEMDYDAQGGHYTALLPATAPGEYNVAILSDIDGEKVNGRFNYTK